MAGAIKRRLTFQKLRTSLFLRSYALYRITEYIHKKYKLNSKLTPKELKRQYYSKRAIPEISKLSHCLNLPYKQIWELIMLNKLKPLNKKCPDREKIKAYLAIEKELITLYEAKFSKSSPFFNPDYDQEFAILSIAIERAAGNLLNDVEDDFIFDQQCEEMKKICLKWYYKIAYRYKLPTVRIVPFVLRLIT